MVRTGHSRGRAKLKKMPCPTPQRVRSSAPSRDMFGGPWLGVIVFVVIAIGLGWGVQWFFKQAGQASDTQKSRQANDSAAADIDPEQIHIVQRDLLLGYTANGTPTLFPARDDLPTHAYGRRSIPTIKQARAMTRAQLKERDLAGVVVRSTPVRFVELVEDPTNAHTRVLFKLEIIEGPYAGPTPVLGMHLETADTDQATGAKAYTPREDLFTRVQSEINDDKQQ